MNFTQTLAVNHGEGALCTLSLHRAPSLQIVVFLKTIPARSWFISKFINLRVSSLCVLIKYTCCPFLYHARPRLRRLRKYSIWVRLCGQ